VAWDLSSPGFTPLLAGQHQQFSIGGQHFPERVLELVAGLDLLAHMLDPLARDAFDAPLAARHEGEGPGGVAFTFRAVASGLATTGSTEGERAGQQISRESEAPQEVELALPPVGGEGASGVRDHLVAIMLQDKQECKRMF
jgi:hypothetical protein